MTSGHVVLLVVLGLLALHIILVHTRPRWLGLLVPGIWGVCVAALIGAGSMTSVADYLMAAVGFVVLLSFRSSGPRGRPPHCLVAS